MVFIIFYRKNDYWKHNYLFAFILVSLLLVYEYRILDYEPHTYIVTSFYEPVEVVENSGINILLVKSFNVFYLEDEEVIRESYEREMEPIIGLYKVTNQDRYHSKTEELLSMIGLNNDHFTIMRENVTDYLGTEIEAVTNFLHREDIEGDSVGLGLVLSELIQQGKIKNNIAIGVTGAIHRDGQIMPVGNIQEKMIISEQHGFPFMIVPNENRKEVETVQAQQKLNIEVHFVDHIDEAIEFIEVLNE